MMKAWCPAGHRPLVAKQGVREYVYAYAAIAPKLGKMTALVLPYVNIEMMELFRQEVSSDFADYFILMQVDQASWHISDQLNIPENIRLIPWGKLSIPYVKVLTFSDTADELNKSAEERSLILKLSD